MSPTEIVETGRPLEEMEREQAKRRKTAGINQHTEPSGKLPEGSTGDTRDKVASSLGVSGRTYEKAKQAVETAQEQPDRFGDRPAMMDEQSVETGRRLRQEDCKMPTKRTNFLRFFSTVCLGRCIPSVEEGPPLRRKLLLNPARVHHP